MELDEKETIAAELSDLEFKDMPVNVSVARDRIQQQYGRRTFAFQKEAIQNSWDARVDKKTGEGWYMEIKVDPKKRTIIIKDHGTTGIEEWKNYLGLWDSSKEYDETAGGTMGQGKMTLLLGDYMVTETYTRHSREHKWAVHTSNGKVAEKPPKDWNRLQYSAGTTITVVNVPQDVLDEFSDVDDFISDIQLTWWELTQKYQKTINYYYDDKCYQIPALEKIKEVQNSEIYSNLRKDISAKNPDGTSEIVSICDFEMRFCVSDTDSILEGVAVNVNQQSIIRYKPNVLRTLTGGILVGSCSVPILRKSQTANHCDFISTDLKWKAVKEYLDKEIAIFVEPYKRRTEITKTQRQRLNKLTEQINHILAKHPEIPFLLSSKSKTTKKEEKIYLGKLQYSPSPPLNKGEDVGITIFLKTGKPRSDLDITVLVEDPLGMKNVKTYKAGKEKYLIKAEFSADVLNEPGTYFVLVKAEDENGVSEEKRSLFRIGKKTTKRKRKKSLKKEKTKRQGIDVIHPFRNPNLKLEAIFQITDGVVAINLSYPTMRTALGLKLKDQNLLYVRAAISAIVNEALKLEIAKAKNISDKEDMIKKYTELNDTLTFEWFNSFGS